MALHSSVLRNTLVTLKMKTFMSDAVAFTLGSHSKETCVKGGRVSEKG